MRPAFDPLRDNGPIFADWPTPRLAIVFTGRQDGYLEPCGCAGLDRMRGGLSRRQTMIASLREKGWPLALFDAGGLAKRVGPQALLKLRTTIEAMTEIGYDAVGLGAAELRFPATDLVTLITGEDGRSSRFMSANVGPFGFAARLTQRKGIVEVAGLKLGVTCVVGQSGQSQVHNPDLEMIQSETALAPLVAEMRSACDWMILLAHATRQEAVDLARRFPEFDIVVTTDGPPVPPSQPRRVEGGKTWLIEVGEKVKDAVVLGVFDDPQQPLRYQRVPLDARFAPSASMKARMAAYQAELRQLGLDGLGVRPLPHPYQNVLGDYVGSQRCVACHDASYKVWEQSGHARATQTLVELDPPRQFDPECIACHMTGWHPRAFLPYEGGYQDMDTTPQLAAVGCETCHGPGGNHVAAEEATDRDRQRSLRDEMAITKDDARQRVCGTCHDVDNSPDFEFAAYWPDIEHREAPK